MMKMTMGHLSLSLNIHGKFIGLFKLWRMVSTKRNIMELITPPWTFVLTIPLGLNYITQLIYFVLLEVVKLVWMDRCPIRNITIQSYQQMWPTVPEISLIRMILLLGLLVTLKKMPYCHMRSLFALKVIHHYQHVPPNLMMGRMSSAHSRRTQ
jgi:hypothetical protein